MELLHKQGHWPIAIGKEPGRAKSTVSRELRRGEAGVPYGAALAQAAAALLGRKARRPSRLTPARVVEIREGLSRGWSPKQIAGRWEQQGRTAAAGPVRHAARAPSQSDACAGDRGAARGDQ